MLPPLENLSHATIITGNRAENVASVKTYLKEQGIESAGNPDVFVFDQDQLAMDTVRDEIIPFVSAKKVSDARFVILSFDRTGNMFAQNALLKSLEEPQPGTHFILIVPTSDELLPTILSRAQVVAGSRTAGASRMDVQEFLRANLAGRFALVEKWTKSKKDEDNLTKTEVINFLDQAEKALWDSGSRDIELFADVSRMREYANIRGASHRVILDFVAMVAPQKGG